MNIKMFLKFQCALQANSLFRAARFVNFEGILCFSVLSTTLADLWGNQLSSKLFMIFLILVSCPQQKFDLSSRFPSLFLSSLGSFSMLFLPAKLAQMIDGTEKPLRSLQIRSAIQRIWLQYRWVIAYFVQLCFFLPKKTQLNEITIVYRHYLSRIIFFLYTTQRIPLISSLYD